MKGATFAACLSLLLCACLSSGQMTPDLKVLYGSHQWFALRDALRAKPAPIFYHAILDDAFNDTLPAEQLLRAVIRSDPKSAEAAEARQKMEDIYQRAGQYRRLLAIIDEELAAKPDDDSLKRDRATIAAFPWDQATVRRRFSKLPYEALDGGVFIPVSVDGKSGEYAVDTDANMSLLSESEAARLGLTVHALAADARRVQGVAGVQALYRTADADEVTVGNLRLKHVAFLILPDNQKPFVDLPPGKRGIIGLPVLLAFQTMRWSADGTFEVDFGPQSRDVTKSNLCFDGADPIVQVEFQQRKVEFIADTGDQESELFTSFASNFPEFVDKSGKKQSLRVTGVDGSVEVPGVILPEVNLYIGGFATLLRSAHVELQQTAANSRWFYGRVGMAIFHQAHQVTFDFHAMTLTLN